MKILYIVNSSSFFCSHFIRLSEKSLELGHKVYILAGDEDRKLYLENKGFEFSSFNISRGGSNPLTEIKTIVSLYKNIRDIKPDLMHMFTIKPIIYGCLINKLFKGIRVPLSVASITGLGSASLSTSFTGKILWLIIKRTYRFVLSLLTTRVIFENFDDKEVFVETKVVPACRSYIVNGAGVNTSVFSPSKDKPNMLTIVLVARLLKDKGIREYIEAGKILKNKNVNVLLKLVGSIDHDNISSMRQEDIDEAHSRGYVDYIGQRNDIANIYQQAHIACLPSYREGLPKSLIEATACGLPIITTDVPGCRQMTHHGQNGILVPVKDSYALAMAIKKLASDNETMQTMGTESRKIAEQIYSHESIVNSFFKIYKFAPISEEK